MSITITLELTQENLEKLKVFTDSEIKVEAAPKEEAPKAEAPKEEPKKKPARKAKVKEEKPEAPEPEKKEETSAAKITKTDIRAKALAMSKAGKSLLLQNIFAEFGAEKLSQIKEEDYPVLMERLVEADA